MLRVENDSRQPHTSRLSEYSVEYSLKRYLTTFSVGLRVYCMCVQWMMYTLYIDNKSVIATRIVHSYKHTHTQFLQVY